ALGAVITTIIYVQAATAVLPLPRRLDPTLIQLGGWDGVSRDLEALCLQHGAGWVASEAYGPASLLAFRAAPGIPVLGAEDRWALFGLPAAAVDGFGLLAISQRRSEPPDAQYWATAEQIGHVVRTRRAAPDGVEAERFRVYRVTTRPGARLVRLPGGRDAPADP
ncbi:MAG: UDP-phosphomannose--protein mannosyltransferase, partial [Gemmatimonadaceae bacterium]|nr:UDP-phosphomannose--protein mannosyltransferase [Acetobacteraceae bacterium]